MKGFIRLFLSLFLLFSTLQGVAQWRFIMEFEVTDGGKNIPGAEVKVFRDGSLVETVRTDAKGRADIPMNPNGEYSIEVGGNKGFIKKIITISTNGVPANTVKGDIFYPAEVELFEKIPDMNVDILDKPIGKIFFDPEYGDFGADRKYTKQVQKQLEDLKSDYLERIAEEEKNAKANKKNYDIAVKLADKAFQAEQWEEAEAQYKKAAALMPLETYPTFQLAELQTKLIKIRENNKKYDDAIASADAALAANQIEKAVAGYQKASGYKPNEEYPKTKITELQTQLQNQAKADQTYLAAIEKGDNALQANDLEGAKKAFQEASVAKPTEDYPKNKIAEIDDIIAKKGAKEAEYKQAIADGDEALKGKNYEQAKQAYEKALGIKPAEAYPKDQIAKVEEILAQSAKKEQEYLAAIEKGDNALTDNKLGIAKTAFESAASIKPDEDYPKNKVKEIDELIASRAAAEKEYQEKIKSADQALAGKKYDEAKASYQAAADLKPTESYPKEKVKEIDGLLAGLAKKEENYKKAIEKGDRAIASKDFPTAKTAFNEALALKPDEKYPKDKLAEIETIVLKNQQVEEEYKKAVQNGDDALANKDYDNAKKFYNEAIGLKAEEQYPKDKIAEIDKAIEDANKLEENYLAAIKEGDDAYKNKDLEKAKSAFTNAGQLKPNEAYPKDQLAKIDTELAGAKKLDEDYNKAIKEGDAAMASMNYTQAKVSFEQALNLKSEESYPAQKIKEIDAVLADMAKVEEEYKKAIEEADEAFGKSEWETAKIAYEAASKIKQNEDYPKNKIKEIDATLDKLAKEEEAAAKLEADYQAAIADGDKKLNEKQLDDAISAYNKALELKPGESYPSDKITEIKAEQERIAQAQSEAERVAALEAKYEKLIKRADDLFSTGKLAEAKKDYEEASTVKTEESYPKEKIDEINQKLAQEQELEGQYSGIIASADELFGSKDYEKAKAKYNEALAIKSGEQYPKDQIKAIDEAIASLAQQQEEIRLKQEKNAAKEEQYDAFIAKADQFFNDKNYQEAKNNYESALGIKEDSYPTGKLAEIETILASLAANEAKAQAEAETEAKYMAAITQADEMFSAQRLQKAKSKYEEALTIKDDPYPKDQIAKLEEALTKKAKRDAQAANESKKKTQYTTVIQRADQEFVNEDFETAKASYQEALKILPNETYPVNKIDQINGILENMQISENAQRAIIESKYMESITLADVSIDNEDYIDAKEYYKNAIGLKPNEEYPKKMLAKIDAIRAKKEQAKIDAQLAKETAAANEASYQTAIANGDRLFAEKKYNDAENEYRLALSLKPKSEYPQTQLDKIKGLMANLNAEAQYQSLIASGSQAFDIKDYRKALGNYEKASRLKPEEPMPKAKIEEINKILEAERLAEAERIKKLDKPIEIQTGPKSTITGDAEAQIEKMYKEIWAKKKEEKSKLVEEKKKKVKELQDLNKQNGDESRKNAIERIEGISISMQEQQKTADEMHLQNYEVVKETEKNVKDTYMELNTNAERNRNDVFADIESFDEDYQGQRQERTRTMIEGKKEMIEKEYENVKSTFKNYGDQQMTQINEAKEQNFEKEKAILEYNKELSQNSITKNREDIEDRTKKYKDAEADRLKADQNEMADEQERISQKEVEQRQFQSSRKGHFKDNQKEIEDKEVALKEETQKLNAESEKRRQDMNDREFYKGEDKPRQDPEAADYPQGVTEEVIENANNSTTIRRIVVEGTEVDTYEKTFFPWGEVFYKKNGTNITQETWDAESK